jgi:hypothetical protein
LGLGLANSNPNPNQVEGGGWAACSPSRAKWRAARSACVRAAAMSHSLRDCIQRLL